MVTQSYSRPGSGISPALVLGLILVALGVVEALLVARFSLQLFASAASEGLGALVLDVSRPLVAPFSTESIGPRSVGWVDRGALLAAAVYLAGALCLMVVTAMAGGLLAGKNVLANRRRRADIARPRQATRLVATASLGLAPDQATRALRLLRLDRLNADLFVIPAEGGCIVAGFIDTSSAGGLVGFGGVRKNREANAIRHALKQIEDRFGAPQAQRAVVQPETPRRAELPHGRPAAASNH
jgi:hypothetical protein